MPTVGQCFIKKRLGNVFSKHANMPMVLPLKLREDKISLRSYEKLQIALLKHVFESRIALRRIFQEMIVLRRIFNYSEEDISGNDSSEEDKSEEDNQLF